MKSKQLLSCVFLLICANYGYSQFASNSFAGKVDFSAGINSQGLTTSDLNLDGKKDVVVANTSTINMFVYLNTSTVGTINNSSFGSGINLTGLASLSLICASDFDGDGKNDLLLGYTNNGNFSVFRNNYTSGTFSASSMGTRLDFSTINSSTNEVAAIDIDLDGKLDVVIGAYNSNNVSIFRNTSTGIGNISFATGINYATGSSTSPTSIALKDINGDNKPELFVSCFNSSIRVYQNTSTLGSASFTYYTAYTAGTGANFLKIQDIDKDGKPDIVCSNYYAATFSVFKNTTTGGVISFNSASIDFTITTSGNYGSGIEVGDLDYDTKPDVVGLGVITTNLGVFRNVSTTGNITTSSFASRIDFTTGSSPNEIRIEDFDGDLRPDIINTNYGSGTFSVYKNRVVSPEPTVASSNITSTTGLSSITLNFTKGNGSKRLIVARTNSSIGIVPIDTNFYTPSLVFGFGTNIGSTNYIVYSDTGSMVTVYGLTYGQVYNFTVYEFNGIGGFSNYLTSSSATTSQIMGDVYFSKSSGALNLLSTWGPNTNGTGTSPSSFSNSSTVFVVANNPAPTLTSNWIVSGTNSFVIVGDGVNALNFTIPAGSSIFTDSISVRANATLTFIGGLIGNKAYFDSLSTAQFTSSTAQNIPGFTYYNLIAANSVKTLTNNCFVRGSLNLLNNINTGIYTLNLGISGIQPGTLNRNASGTISGRFKRWFANSTNTGTSGLFPMLIGTNYRPATVEFTTAPTSAGTLTSEFFSTPPGNSGLYLYDFSLGFIEVNKASVNGYWKIDPTALTGGTFTLTLTGTGFYGISVVADLRLVKRQTSGAWTLPAGSTAIAGTGSTAAPIVGRSGYTGFGEFTIAGDSTQNPLPVKWLSFDGVQNENGILLNWKTSNEINNTYFVVERKFETQQDFEDIERINPITIGLVKSYNYLDQHFGINKVLYYRIKQVDYDGKISFSNTIIINAQNSNEEIIIEPNPTQDFILIKNFSSHGHFELIDASGRIISIKLENNKIKLNNIPSGIYFLNLVNLDGLRKTIRIIKQ